MNKEMPVNEDNQQINPAIPEYQLGEYLLRRGLLTGKQLDDAIEYQCIYGGKLGTSLIELGLVTEDQVAKALSRQLKLHYIKPERLMHISESTLTLIPEDIAAKYQVVPYRKKGTTLYVALNEMSNQQIIKKLSHILGHTVIPLAIPEVRLIVALKHHYQISPPSRFELLAAQVNKRTLAKQKIAAKREEKGVTDKQSEDISAWPLLGEEDYSDDSQVDGTYLTTRFTPSPNNPVDLMPLLADAKQRDDIATAVITYLKRDFPETALFMVRDNVATGWLATKEAPKEIFQQISIPLLENSIFNLVATSQSYYLGPVPDSRQNHKILSYFAGALPLHALVLPLFVGPRLVAILYVQGQLEPLEKHLIELQNIVEKAEMSFRLLILRNKILSN